VRAEGGERDRGVVATLVLRGDCRRLPVVAPDAVDNRHGGHCGHPHGRQDAEPGYPATSAAAGASFSPNLARGTNWPIPGLPTTSPASTITFPRRSTVSMSPTTSVPS
jgi:hypothetical protein